MKQKNPILNFRKKYTVDLEKKVKKSIASEKLNNCSMITKTRESIDMTENS